jgi:hypothetical protein
MAVSTAVSRSKLHGRPPRDFVPCSIATTKLCLDTASQGCCIAITKHKGLHRGPYPRNVLTVAAAISAVTLPPANTLADLYLNAVCAEHLVHELRVAGLEVVRAAPERLRE